MTNKTTAEGLFTEEQIKYVDSVKDEHLRSHLLHQVRLRDLMEQDRNAFEKESSSKDSVEHAMKVLKYALKKDDDYRRTWKDNIAITFHDTYFNKGKNRLDGQELHNVFNESADNFLNLLCS